MQTSSNIWDKLDKPFFILAPMDDVTDTVFRQIVADCASPDLFFTEFVNVDGLQSPGRPKLLKKLRFTPKERPLIAQIWGNTPENYYKTAKELADSTLLDEINWLRTKNGDAVQGKSEARSKAYIKVRRTSTGALDTAMRSKRNGSMPGFAGQQADAVLSFAGVDINFGCPEKTVIKNGSCIAMINTRSLASEIIQATQEGLNGKLPLSVKTRLGLNQVDLSWHEFLLGQKLNALTIHGRTAKQMSAVPADWEIIGQIRELRDKISPTTKIIGNGDVLTRADGQILAAKNKLDGIMIGRGIFNDPFVFSKDSPWKTYTRGQKLTLYQKHIELFDKTWIKGERNLRSLNKFCKIYVNGFDGASDLRVKLMSCNSAEELLNELK